MIGKPTCNGSTQRGLFWSSSLLIHLGKQLKKAQVFGSLLLVWEMVGGIQTPEFLPGPVLATAAVWNMNLPLEDLSPSVWPSLFNSTFQINKRVCVCLLKWPTQKETMSVDITALE